ncbi:hypothetical protein ILUMI_18505 [Ignelater luminosus]|uniref:CHK kinase-like domain-containing protein n=1 Tax=Ignelater luminosus TaxID=2038154 RepID=A0A8K0G6T7_IGNLU|nr:hypothetical protein ILUMI_18505 [Ignelater luminosus]
MYDVVFRSFKQFEVNKKLKPTSLAPKFYKSNLEYKSEILVLENLASSNYKMYQATKVMDAKHVSVVLEKYARLHALGFALRDQNITKFEEITNAMNEMFIKFLKNGNYIKAVKHIALKSLTSLREDVDTKAYKIYKNHIINIDKIFDDLRNAANDDYTAIVHGDGWTNNMMFQYDDLNDPTKPTSVRFIDFQLARLGPPVLDLAFFLYTCSEKKVIEALEDYLRLYYNSLVAHLVKLGSDPDKVYPYSIFLKQWRKYAKLGFTLAITVIYILLTDESEAVDLNSVAETGAPLGDAFDYEIAKSDLYYDRVRHIILHCVEKEFM